MWCKTLLTTLLDILGARRLKSYGQWKYVNSCLEILIQYTKLTFGANRSKSFKGKFKWVNCCLFFFTKINLYTSLVKTYYVLFFCVVVLYLFSKIIVFYRLLLSRTGKGCFYVLCLTLLRKQINGGGGERFVEGVMHGVDGLAAHSISETTTMLLRFSQKKIKLKRKIYLPLKFFKNFNLLS